MGSGKQRLWLAVIAGLSGLVFALDLLIPTGVVVWVLYLPLIFAAVPLEAPRWVLLVAAVCAAWTAADLFLSPPGVPFLWAVGNRALALATIGLTALAALAIGRRSAQLGEANVALQQQIAERRRGEEALRRFNDQLEREVAERTAHLEQVNARLRQEVEERQRAEAALREGEERLRLFIEHAPAALAMFDRQMRYLAASRRWMTDYRLGDVTGRTHYDLFTEMPARWMAAHRRGLAGEVVRADEDEFTRAGGQVQWLRWEIRPWRGADGAVGGIVIFTEDVTARKLAEQALRAGQERLDAILNTAADAIITINRQGVIQSVNPATERVFGYTTTEMVGQNVKMLMPSPFRDEHDGYLRRYLETGQPHIIGKGREVFARRKDGSTFPISLAVSEVPDLQLFTGIVSDISWRKRLECEVIEIAALEQRRIGQDLHDTVGQELTALNLLAGALAEAARGDAPTDAMLIERLTEGLRRVQRDLRAVLHGLLPVAVDAEGLMAALTDLAERIHQAGTAACTFDCPEPVLLGDNLTATHLFLIAREAVHNAVKHARPRHVRISLTANDLLVLRVQDDGVGIAARPRLPTVGTAAASEEGLGLRIMRNRATIIGATLSVEPADPVGTLVTCTLPRKDHERSPERHPSAGPDHR